MAPPNPNLQAAWLLLAPYAPAHLALLRHAYVTSNICTGGSHPYRSSLDCSNLEMPRQSQRVYQDCNQKTALDRRVRQPSKAPITLLLLRGFKFDSLCVSGHQLFSDHDAEHWLRAVAAQAKIEKEKAGIEANHIPAQLDFARAINSAMPLLPAA